MKFDEKIKRLRVDLCDTAMMESLKNGVSAARWILMEHQL
jgi:hypothetical protein